MGLGAPKRRTKLSQDPNNTQWSKSTAGYGHKILSAQGWRPGDYLGAENASHADHYTGANAPHIRVLLREDNLGLGAQVGKVNAETFGLSLFSGVLGRLNGKSDAEVQKYQNALRDVELRTYQEQKYGHMNFVSGGFLVGDRIEFSPGGGSLLLKQDMQDASEAVSDTGSKSQMREGGAEAEATERTSKKKKREAFKQRLGTDGANDYRKGETGAEHVKESRVRKRSQKRSKTDQRAQAVDADENEETAAEDERSRRKQERRARKETRRRRKDEKQSPASTDQTSEAKTTCGRSDDGVAKNPSTTQSTNIFAGNRHAVRQRYIQQKRMASLDPQAMKEIFMLKPTATAA